MDKLKLAGFVTGVVAFLTMAGAIVWLKRDLDHTHERLGKVDEERKQAVDLANKNAQELATYKGQVAGAEQVASAVQKELAAQQRATEQQNRRTYSAPLNQQSNDVVPGVVADTYDWLYDRRQPAGAGAGAGRPAAAAGSPDQRLPAGAAGPAARQPAPK